MLFAVCNAFFWVCAEAFGKIWSVGFSDNHCGSVCVPGFNPVKIWCCGKEEALSSVLGLTWGGVNALGSWVHPE
ncbi:unnamed protein product [Cuscuta campestris]|uniref:Secreted protein n=1 Tax=Cuscuta campestris TaxID=132261 RepID=A0A484LTZ9_9ASTE|nr:unnamed protein product [Cuscuta campestris]